MRRAVKDESTGLLLHHLEQMMKCLNVLEVLPGINVTVDKLLMEGEKQI